jgi:hypothetical protein
MSFRVYFSTCREEIDNQVSIWVSLPRVEALGHFGTVEQVHAAMDRLFVLCEPRAAPGETNTVDI